MSDILLHPVYRMIDISEDLAVIPCPGMIVRKVDEDRCVLFTPGQDATSAGFLIERPWDSVIGEINDEIERAVDEARECGGEEEEDEEDGDQA